MTEIGQCRHLQTGVFCDKTEIVRGVMRHGEGFEIYFADAKFAVRFDLDRSVLNASRRLTASLSPLSSDLSRYANRRPRLCETRKQDI